MWPLSFQPFLFQVRAEGQSSITASCGTGRGKIRKGWNVGQGDLCGVELFDNLSELEVAHG